MRRMRRQRRGQAGFTLIELMISLVMFSFAVAGVLAVAVAMATGFREQKGTIGAEGAARSAMEFMADSVRGGGPGVLNASSLNIENLHTCGKGAFVVTNSNTGPDRFIATFAYGSVVTSSTQTYAAAQASLTVASTAQFAADDWILISDTAQGHLVQIDSVTDATTLALKTTLCGALTVAFPAGGVYPRNSLVVRVLRAEFFIQNLDGVPTLYMDPDTADGTAAPEPLAEGVEDLQVELGVDPAGDGILEDASGANVDEWSYNFPGAAETVLDPTAIVRGVRITLVARSVGQVTGIGNYYRPLAGDHAASTVPDNYRRRTLKSVIEIRNGGGSP